MIKVVFLLVIVLAACIYGVYPTCPTSTQTTATVTTTAPSCPKLCNSTFPYTEVK